jgi:phage major head subunit gpT-like protein
MDINRNVMDSFFRGINLAFMKEAQKRAAESKYLRFAMVVTSSTAIETYPFLDQFGGMREWIGERQIKNISSKKMECKNRDFEETISVPANDIKDDQYGIYSNLAEQLAFNAGVQWDILAAEALLSDPNWLDGAKFFKTDRKYGKNTICNKCTDALSAESYGTARKTIMAYKGHDNKPMRMNPNLLVIGPKNEDVAFGILKDKLSVKSKSPASGAYVGGATDNPWYNTADYIVLDDLTGDYDDYWFLMDVTRPLRAVVVQKRELPKLISLDNFDDENVFKLNKFLYGTSLRGAAFLSMPHLAYAGIL